jgi:hypothetical protein
VLGVVAGRAEHGEPVEFHAAAFRYWRLALPVIEEAV